MKKFALSLIIGAGALFGMGAAASAQYDPAPTIPTTTTTTTTIAGSGVVVPATVAPTTAAPTTVAPAAVAPTTVAATIPSGGLPATGSRGLAPTSSIAIGLLVVGLGLFVVARVRRQSPTAA